MLSAITLLYLAVIINYEQLNPTEEKTIVFIHGLSDTLDFWDPLVSQLYSSYRTITYDLRGHGHSEYKICKPDISVYERDLLSLLQTLKVRKAVFVGFSMGSLIAQRFAIDHPEMVKGLVLMSTYSYLNAKTVQPFIKFENALNNNYEEFFDSIIPYVMSKESIEQYKEVLEELKKEKAKTANIEGLLSAVRACKAFNDYTELKSIKTPTIIFAGEKDQLTTMEMQTYVKDNIKGAVLIELEDTYHNVLTDPNVPKILDAIKKLW